MENVEMIYTTKGMLPISTLEKKQGLREDENEYTTWVEYYLQGELVHRSMHVTLKPQNDQMGSILGGF